MCAAFGFYIFTLIGFQNIYPNSRILNSSAFLINFLK